MRIVLKQSYTFTAPNGTKTTFYADPFSQDVPDWMQAAPEYALLKKSGHIEIMESPLIAPVVQEVSQAVQPDVDLMVQHENRQTNSSIDDNTPPKAGVEAVLTPEEEAESYRKSSGIDGPSGDWTASGQTKDGFPVAKGSPEDVTATAAEKAAYAQAQKGL